jgi:hypothetical protein
MATDEPSMGPVPYRVVYSGLVRQELMALMGRAMASGHGPDALAAVREIDNRLRVYPQFGEPLRDLHMEGQTASAPTPAPLFIEYIVDEPHRAVFVVVPLRAMPHAGFE